jgi:Putative DNA-binding domain
MEQSPPPPKPKVIFDEPEKHWGFLMLPSDADFEGQHFERKEACRVRTDGEVSRSDIRKLEEHIVETISAFSNANRLGGLLVLGISSAGEIRGTGHLREDQVNSLIRLETKLVNHNCQIKLVEVTNADGRLDHIAFL